MKVRLRVLHGKLQDKEGHGKGLEVMIHGPRFVIGSSPDCSMCCKSTSVSPQHCEILLDDRRARVRCLCEEAGTFVNDQRVEGQQVLHDGDHLRVGRLEFQILIEMPAAATGGPPDEELDSDREAEELSDMLVKADEQDREFRLEHPEVRVLHLESAEHKDGGDKAEKEEEHSKAKKKDQKGKPLPGGLPPPPVHETADSTEAAQEALRRLFRP